MNLPASPLNDFSIGRFNRSAFSSVSTSLLTGPLSGASDHSPKFLREPWKQHSGLAKHTSGHFHSCEIYDPITYLKIIFL